MSKNLITIFVVLILVFSVGLVMAADDSLQKIKEEGKFVLGLDDNFPPMGFRDESGNIVGFDIDLAKEVANRMGVEVELKPVEWDGIIFSLKNGTIDVIWNGLTITEERAKQIAFSTPYLDNRQIIIVKKDSPINTKADLANKVVGLQLGSSSENALNSEPDVVETLKEVRQFSNNVEALMDLEIGRVDAVVVDEIVGRYYISKKPDVYRVLMENFGQEIYGVGLRMEDEAFLNELNRILDEMKADGTAKEISEKWFGEDIVKR